MQFSNCIIASKRESTTFPFTKLYDLHRATFSIVQFFKDKFGKEFSFVYLCREHQRSCCFMHEITSSPAMTDSEKIAAIITDKHLTNAQFCQTCGLQPATLSHITSGRSNPSLTILRSIVQGFPDINPLWLFTGEGDMYGSPTSSTIPSPTAVSSPSASATSTDNSAPNLGSAPQRPGNDSRAVSSASTASPTDGALMATGDGIINAASQDKSNSISNPSPSVEPAQGTPPSTLPPYSHPEPLPPTPTSQSATAGSPSPIPLIVQEPPQRRNIVEIRVFYDDNTFEILTRKG